MDYIKKEIISILTNIIDSIGKGDNDGALFQIINFIDTFSKEEFAYLQNNEMNIALNNIVEGLEKQDYVLISDVFEYEVLPYIKEH